ADQKRRQYRLEEALLLCDEGLYSASQAGNLQAEGICLLHRWAINYMGQKYPDAIDDSKRSMRSFADLGDTFGEISAWLALGMAYEAQGLQSKARGRTEKSISALQNALRAYNYDNALELINEAKRQPAFGRHHPRPEQYHELLDEIKQRFQQVMARYARGVSLSSAAGRGSLIILPVLSQPIAAGTPIPTLEKIDCYAEIVDERASFDGKEYVVRRLDTTGTRGFNLDSRDDCCFIMPVAGKSMNRTLIQDGDHVIIQRPKQVPLMPLSGDIVAATIIGKDLSATLKRFAERNGKFILEPESTDPAHKPCEFTPAKWDGEVTVAGVAIAVLKEA
ncbi:MAG: hypothetical protein CVU38_18210, partial [Chloroflexi bacterium HGW-Chloroflexi-1]